MFQGSRLFGGRLSARLAASVTVAVAAVAVGAGSASAAALTAHGQLLHVGHGAKFNANQSSNWFGYAQGTLEQGSKLFNSITGDWTVPAATQHTSGTAEASSDWIGIGGGCVDAGCTVTDSTLIQTGTEQDVDATGAPSYSAWWELVPAPSISISTMTVSPGDHMHASLSEVVNDADVWNITIADVTKNETFTTTVPYPSTHGTAEWIEETPLEIGTDAGFAALPNLTNPAFSSGTVNGAAVKLTPAEEMQLIDSNGNVIGTPSAPNAAGSGFDACTWATACS
jgi:hypothetical protein